MVIECSILITQIASVYNLSNKLIRQFLVYENLKRIHLDFTSLNWLPDSKRIAISAKNVNLWDVETGKKTLEVPHISTCLGVSITGKSIIGLGPDQMSILKWHLEKKKLSVLFSGRRKIYRLTTSQNGKWIAFADNQQVRIQSVDGVVKHSWNNGATALAFSSDSKLLAIGGHERTIDLWSIEHKKIVKKIAAPGFPTPIPTTISLAFSPDKKLLACSGGLHISDGIGAFYGIVTLLDAQLPTPKKIVNTTANPHNLKVIECPNRKRVRKCRRGFRLYRRN